MGFQDELAKKLKAKAAPLFGEDDDEEEEAEGSGLFSEEPVPAKKEKKKKRKKKKTKSRKRNASVKSSTTGGCVHSQGGVKGEGALPSPSHWR